MNGMLHRLAAQARQPRAVDSGARIRSAAGTHPQYGIAISGDGQGVATLQPAIAPARTGHPAQTIQRPMVPAPGHARVSPLAVEAAAERRTGFDMPSELLAHDVARFAEASHREGMVPGIRASQPAVEAAAAAPHMIAPAPQAFELPRHAQSGAQREPTEVHVHIGRIEVAAVQDSTPAPRARAAPRKGILLAGYLARGRS